MFHAEEETCQEENEQKQNGSDSQIQSNRWRSKNVRIKQKQEDEVDDYLQGVEERAPKKLFVYVVQNERMANQVPLVFVLL